MNRIESLLKIADMKFDFQNLEICFHKRQVLFLVVKTIKCKRGISYRLDNIATGKVISSSTTAQFLTKSIFLTLCRKVLKSLLK